MRERERERGTSERQSDRERGKQRFTFLGKAGRTGFAIRAGGAPQQKAAAHMAPSSSSESSSEDDSGSDTDGVTAKPPPTKKPKRVEGADEEGSSEDDGLPRSHDVEQKAGGGKTGPKIGSSFSHGYAPITLFLTHLVFF